MGLRDDGVESPRRTPTEPCYLMDREAAARVGDDLAPWHTARHSGAVRTPTCWFQPRLYLMPFLASPAALS